MASSVAATPKARNFHDIAAATAVINLRNPIS
jgi:hypothetical protein